MYYCKVLALPRAPYAILTEDTCFILLDSVSQPVSSTMPLLLNMLILSYYFVTSAARRAADGAGDGADIRRAEKARRLQQREDDQHEHEDDSKPVGGKDFRQAAAALGL